MSGANGRWWSSETKFNRWRFQRVSPSSWFCLMRCRVCYDGAFIFIFASVMVSRVPYPVPESGYHFICPSALGTFWYAFVTTYAKALPEGRPWPVGRLRLGWNRRWWLIELSFGITRLIDGPCNTSPVSEFNQHHRFFLNDAHSPWRGVEA